MAYIVEIPNPFQPHEVIKHQHPGGISIRRWLETRFPGFVEFENPTICVVNGDAILRKDWNRIIGKNDVVGFVGVAPGAFATVLLVALVVAAVVLSFAIPLPVTPGEIPASDPVFSVKGRNNDIRLGEPIEVVYGKNRIFPAFASRPYYQYIDNEQYLFSLFCLGQGRFDIESIRISDTDIDEFEEAEYEVTEGGENPSLFPINVYTSTEAGGQTLYGPNEEGYGVDGWVGPFPANPANTETDKIQIDLVYPQGIYSVDNKGRLGSMSVYVVAEARLIDDAGVPLGAYFALTDPSPIVVSGATTTPQRRTFTGTVALGRYEVRLRRTDNRDTSTNRGHVVTWEGMRSYLDDTPDFGDVTLLAVKIRATSNLNDRTQAAFNVIATRMIPVYESGGFTDPQASRSIVWAFVDIFRSEYGGRIEDTFFDFDALETLDALYTSRGDYFDWIFRDSVTVWEAARTVARAGRAVPLLIGSLITMKRDGPLEIPVAMFNQDNIVKGSFQWNVVLWEKDRNDSISITYIDPDTEYKEEQVIASLPGGSTDNTKEVRLPGVGSRAQAYREGMYMVASERYLRENIVFDTGMEGHIPTFGDLIAIAHDVPRWGQGGLVVHAEAESDDTYRLWLSEPINWGDSEAESGEYQILLRGRSSTLIGPLTVTMTSDPQQVLVNIPAESSGDVDFLLTGTTEPMMYLFGLSGEITKYGKVVKIEPQGGEIVRITAVNDAPVIHSFDELTAPPLSSPYLAPLPPDLPEISSLTLTQIDSTLLVIQASWTAAFGAQSYLVQTSEDGTNWQNRASTTRTAVQLQVRPGSLWVRVAAVNNGQGPWVTEETTVLLIAGLENHVPWDDLTWGVRWVSTLGSIGYQIDVYDNATTDPTLKRSITAGTDELEYVYTYAMALADGNLSREMLVEVTPLFIDDDSGSPPADPASLALSNAIPSAPASPSSSLYTLDSDSVVYRLTWSVPAEEDLVRLVVWLSDVDGFDPEVDTPVVDELISSPGSAGIPTEAFVDIALDTSGEHAAHYWRVAVFDVWGDEISTNVSSQQTIAAYA